MSYPINRFLHHKYTVGYYMVAIPAFPLMILVMAKCPFRLVISVM